MKNYFYILFVILFWIFIIGIFTNFFGFYHSISKSSVYIDCGKNISSQYCNGEFDEYQWDKIDNASRIINP